MACSLTYRFSVTGDCLSTNVGAFNVDIYGSAPPYSIQWVTPYTTTIPLGAGVTAFTQTGLSAGTYSFYVYDSCSPSNTRQLVNINISSGTCVSITNQTDTLCGLNNGSLTAQTTNSYGTSSFYLYETTYGYITSGQSITGQYVTPSNLSAGTYYVIGNDGGGCTGRSESCIIKSSTTVDFGLYIVNDAGCTLNSGKIFVTGLTGFPPYYYLWSNGQTTPSITGLSSGSYSVSITDSTGCQQSRGGIVSQVPPMSIYTTNVVSPSCYGSDGELTIYLNGGTPPYYYLASNGDNFISFSQIQTFTGLSSGSFSVQVTDAALCNYTYNTSILTPGGLTVLGVTIVNSVCNNLNGELNPINVAGGSPPYTYTLDYPGGGSTSQTTNSSTFQFTSLSSGTYNLQISDNGPCVFSQNYTISNSPKFTISTTFTGTTCDNPNGAINILLSTGGTPPYTYELVGVTSTATTVSGYTFTGLSSGTYLARVTDTTCTQEQTVTITGTGSVDFILVGTDSLTGNNGEIDTFITDGEPPFVLNWSSNVNGQTGLTVTNLSAGTYTLQVTDNIGCTLTRTITINGYNRLVTYQSFNYCSGDFTNNGYTVVKKPQQMLVEGFYDLTSDEENCILNEAIFYAQVSVNGVSGETSYFTGTTLGEYPTDSQWFATVQGLLQGYPEIGEVTYDPIENIIRIETSCDTQVLSIGNVTIDINFKISYDISCVCPLPTPTPGPDLGECDMIYIMPGSEIYGYNFDTNTTSPLTVAEYTFDSPSIVHTNNKLYLYETVGSVTNIKEWVITTAPFAAIFNRTITVNTLLGNSLGIDSGLKLYSTDISVTPNKLVKLDITTNTAVITDLTELPIDRSSVGNIQTTNDYIWLLNQSTSSDFYLTLYDIMSYEQVYDLELTPTVVNQPSGLFVDSGTVYVVDLFGGVYSIDMTTPYNITFNTTITGAWVILSISQITKNCFNPTFNLPMIGCSELITMTGSFNPFDGIFETYVDLGAGRGTVELDYLGSLIPNTGLITRAQIYWDNVLVADSLFLSYYIANGTLTAYNADVLTITSTTTLNKYVYNNPYGNSTTPNPPIEWTTNGQVDDLSFTPSDVAPYGELRLSGSNGNQIGVVPNYPSPAAKAGDTDIKLQFTKTNTYPTECKIVVTSLSPSTFNFIIGCPIESV